MADVLKYDLEIMRVYLVLYVVHGSKNLAQEVTKLSVQNAMVEFSSGI